MLTYSKPLPFKPDCPTDFKNFTGRNKLIKEHIRYLNQACLGVPQHFLISGEKSMGKSSFGEYLKNYAERVYDMIAVHVYAGAKEDVNELICLIVEEILNEINGLCWAEDIFEIFNDKIDFGSVLSRSVKFKDKNDSLIKNIRYNFPGFLVDLIKQMSDKKGIFIIIDDINGLSKTPDFANWYKSFTDTLATSFYDGAPVAVMLSAHPDKINALYNHNPSFNRIFIHREIGSLENDEVRDFFIRSFNQVGMTIDDDALNLMLHFSSGHPTMMQEIGAGIYWTCEEDNVSYEDAFKGIIRAGEEIGIKYLKSSLDSSILSDKYLNIFTKFGDDFIVNFDGEYSFKKKDFSKSLDEKEKKVFSDFLIRARQLGILDLSGAKKSGHYKFTNNLFPLYFAIKSLESKQF